MATWNKLFSNFAWKNKPDTSTPLGQTLLNRINTALNGVDDRVITLNAQKASTDDLNGSIVNVSLNENTGVFTFTRFDGTNFTINTALEEVVTNFVYDYETQSLVLTLADGTTQNVNLSALITQYEFTSSATILFTVGADGKVTANIKPNSITDQMLQTNYLSDITTQANTAVSASQSALESQSLAEQSAEDADRHADRAEAAANRAESIVGFTVDTELSTSSTNPIANKAVAEALENVDAKTLNGNAVGYFAKDSDLAIERERITNLATLTEGSTTGDAELIDIRVGEDGVTYDSAGEAVRTQFANVKSDLSELDNTMNELLFDEETEKENLYDSTTLTSGKFVNYLHGTIEDNENFSASDFIAINPLDLFEIVGNSDVQVAVYDDEKQYITGYEKARYFNEASTAKELPQNVAYLRISVLIGQEEKMQVNHYYLVKKVKNEIVKTYTVVTVGSENCDFDNLRTCLESITPTENNPYKVLLSAGTYDIKSYYTNSEKSASDFKGLFIPDYTELIGLSGKENTLIIWDNTGEDKNDMISPINIRNVATLKGLTIKAVRVRYAVHDDFATKGNDNIRVCENCEFISLDGAKSHCYGSGHFGRANWLFKNCTFNCPTTMYAFLNHNNVNVSECSMIEFDNCRFLSDVIFASMTNGATGITNVIFKGCNCRNGVGKIELVENSASQYGRGILFKVSGYANNFNNDKVVFKNTDGVDYSDYADLI